MYHLKKEERARVAKIREAARISGREARVREDQANTFTERVQECRQLRSGASTAQDNGTHGISSKVGIKGGPNNNNNNGPNNNNNRRDRRERDRNLG